VISGILYFSVLLGLVIAQVYRYRRVSTPAQRQQTKWVVYSLAVTFILVIGLFGIPSLIFPVLVQNGSLFSSVASFVANALFILLPISFGVAILRYRLWDVDVLINRTLVYGTLTGLLALVYFGLIIGLQYLLRGLINQTNDVAIVISTLAIAALFQPLRRRIQSMIDRRFYRRKYDAVKTLAAFSAPLRNEVDLNQLREQLVAVVEETMQPTFVSLWLRPPTHDGKQRAPWRANLPVSSGER
jgi:glucan phosphoethanolaminetransferase (alkaline phosphatase superfamily)